jgi:hypothetical protein
MSIDVLPKRPRTGSRRLRRVTWTAATLVVLAFIAAVVSWRIRKENAPEEYTPGEASKDITSALSTPVAQATPGTLKTVKNAVSSRVVDRLVDAGRNLPPGIPKRINAKSRIFSMNSLWCGNQRSAEVRKRSSRHELQWHESFLHLGKRL